MGTFIIKRLGQSLVVVILVTIIAFALLGKLCDWLLVIATAPLLRWRDSHARAGEA